MAEGEIHQAHAVATRAVRSADERESGKWGRRLARLSGLLTILDIEWAPDRLILDESRVVEPPVPLPGRILSFYKASLPYARSGYTIRTQRSVEAQQAAGFVVCPCTPINADDTAEASIGVGTVEYRRLGTDLPFPTGSAAEDLEVNAHSLYAAAMDVRPALVHAASGFIGPEIGLVGLSVARALRVPFVYEVRGVLSETWGYSGEKLPVHRQMSWLRWLQEVRLARAADAVVVLSEGIRSELERSGAPVRQIHVVPNAVDSEMFEARRAHEGLMERLNPSGLPVVGYISNFGRREGHLVLVDAVAKLKERGTELKCLLIGDGPMREEVSRRVRSLALSDFVSVVGPVPHEDVADYYSLLDVFVVPREDDRAARYTTPLKPFEAMAMSVPLVVSDLPALREIVGDSEERGSVFHPGSSESLSRVLAGILGDREKALAKAEAAKAWVVKERQWSHNAERYRAAFDSVGVRPS
ncbi:MAG: glycosyltransferase [Acidimicrobiia bacterium]|nr:glycosyltransferase [Acidimicrobiia bacterium]